MSSSETTELAVPVQSFDQLAELQKNSQFTPDDFAAIAGSGVTFLPRLQLFTSNADAVKTMQIPVGHYGLQRRSDDPPEDLGKTCLIVPLAWRPKAMFTKHPDGKPRQYYNRASEIFLNIVKAADANSNSGNMYGPEYLVYLPNGTELSKYATFFFGSKTARNTAPTVTRLLGKPVVCTSRLIQNKEYTWQTVDVNLSNQSVSLPDMEELARFRAEFMAPKDSVEAPAASAEEQQAASSAPSDR